MSWISWVDIPETATFWLAALGSGYIIYKIIHARLAMPSAIHTLRGPGSPSWVFGNNRITRGPYPGEAFERWRRDYGTTFSVHTFLGGKELVIADTQTTAYVLNRPLDFPKTRFNLNLTKCITGNGILAVEGLEHKWQRKMLNPAFGTTMMREISPMLLQVAQELRDTLKKRLLESASGLEFREIDVHPCCHNVTLDMIGLAGFSYRLNSLHDSDNELATAYHNLSTSVVSLQGMGVFNLMYPSLRHLPIGSNVANNRHRAVMDRVGSQLVEEKKAETERLGNYSSKIGKDMLSTMIRANTTEHATTKLDDGTLLAEISTLLVAGHTSTATALTWGLCALAQAPEVQSRLRDELLAFPHDSPSMEEFNGLPYLNSVVKEMLRLRPANPTMRRMAGSDSILPLAKPIVDKNGKEVYEIFVQKGDSLMIHMYAINTRADIWGPDALEFKPDRFNTLPEAVSDIPSVFGNVATFAAGPRGCIGWRFAVLQMKAVLFTLIREFNFDIDPQIVITSKFALHLNPQVQGQEEKGPQLPLRVSLHQS